MGVVTLTKGAAGKIVVIFPYSPDFVAKVKNIPGHRWYRENKSWSLPHTDEIIEKILRAFEGEEIRIDPALKSFILKKQSPPSLQEKLLSPGRPLRMKPVEQRISKTSGESLSLEGTVTRLLADI
ncbi:MAG TPA: hypothetical protein VI728_08855 [Syntrophales bacterium]|nr:hypothetical protein [Syntrophales bacterium]